MKSQPTSATSLTKNFKVYKASAGTGKTFTLIAEYLSLCLLAPATAYKSILATTFTNKATKELKYKLFEHILNIISQNKAGMAIADKVCNISGLTKDEVIENSRTLFTQMLHDYSNINILTIDGFVQRVSRAFASDLGLSFDYNVMINTDDASDDIVEMFSDQLNENTYPAQLAENWVDYNIDEGKKWNFKDNLTEIVKGMLANREKRTVHANDLGDINKLNECEKYLNKHIKETDKSIDELASQMMVSCSEFIGNYEFKYINKNVFPSIIDKLEKRETSITKFYTKTISEFKDNPTKCFNKTYKKGECMDAAGLSVTLFNTLDVYFSLIERKTFLVLVRNKLYELALNDYLLQLIAEYEDKTHNIPISEFNVRVAKLLDDFSAPFIYERIGERFKNYFIDEFQDTSILQWRNFLPLVDNGLSSNKVSFVVGDAKQAIYRFRGGEVEQIIQLPRIYRNDGSNRIMAEYENTLKRQHFEDKLKKCFRSSKNVIKFNNEFFKFASDVKLQNYKDVYQELEQEPVKDIDGLVEIDILKKNKDQVYDKYCIRCLELIEHLHNERKYKYKDIAILTRNNDKGIIVAQFLKEHNIPITSSETLLLKNSKDVRTVIGMLKYLQDPSNPIRIAELLYSRLFADGKRDLSELGGMVHSVKKGQRIEDLLNIDENVDLMSMFSNTCNTYDLCESLIRILNLDPTGDEYLRFLLEDIHNFQSSSCSSVSDYIDHWDKLSDKKLIVKSSDQADAVNIMTIHKSKGLEFKVVIYPYASPDLDLKMDKERYIVSRKGAEGNFEYIDDEVINGIPYVNNFEVKLTSKISETNLNAAYKIIEEQRTLDELNVLYVALTRPKDRLYIITEEKDKSLYSNFLKSNGDADNDRKLNLVEGEFDGEYSGKSYTLGTDVDNKETDNPQTNKLEAVASRTIDWFSQMNFTPREVYHNEAERWGVLVHEILSKVKIASDISPIAESYAAVGKLTQEQCADLIDKFNKVVSDPRISDSFGNDAIVRNEMDFIDSQGKHIRPDRFTELADRIVIIDYKTGAKDASYHKQLKDYASALSLLSNKRIECYLLYIGTNLELEKVEIQ